MDTLALEVHTAISNVCPIVGVSIRNRDDSSTWRIDYQPGATQAQRDAAVAVVAGFVPAPFVPVPSGVHVHHWPELGGWVDGQKITITETPSGPPHHECYYIIADNQAALDALTAMPQMQIKQGQLAFLTDHNHLMYWNSTKWVQGW